MTGSYKCSCDKGYKLNHDRHGCDGNFSSIDFFYQSSYNGLHMQILTNVFLVLICVNISVSMLLGVTTANVMLDTTWKTMALTAQVYTIVKTMN